jgi:hypothetical protein
MILIIIGKGKKKIYVYIYIYIYIYYKKLIIYIYDPSRLYRPFGGEFVELSMGGENDNSNFCITEHGELLGLLKKPCSALAEGNLPVHRVLNPLQLNLSTSHLQTTSH